MIKHLRFMMAALLMAVFSGAFATETVTFELGDFTASGSAFSSTKDEITVSCTNGALNQQIRVYAGSSIIFSCDNGLIKEIVITCNATGTNKYGPGQLSGTGYTASEGVTGTWTGSAESVTLSAAAQARITSIDVTYELSGKIKPDLSFGDNDELTVELGDEFTAPELLNLPEGVGVSYVSDNSNVATVNATTGAVTIKGLGKATITATSEETDTYKSATASYTIIVNPKNAVFYDTFDKTNGTGGRDGAFSGQVGSSTIVSDETGGLNEDNPEKCGGAKQCLKFGTGSADGVFSITFNLEGDGTLTFSAAGWASGDNYISIEATGAIISPDGTITLNNGEWNDYEFELYDANGEVTLTFTGRRGFIDDILVVQKEAEANTVEYTIPAGGLGTFVCEEALDFSDFADAKAYYSTGLNAQKNCVAVVRIEGAVEANTPIIIEGTGTVNIPVADENATFADVTGNKLVGSATESTNLDGVNCMIISASDGKFHPCSGGTLAAGKAYLDVDPSELGANAKLAIEEIDSDPTAISEVKSQMNNGAIYNLQGVRVEKAQKGIYIMNGKKVIFK